MTDDRVTAVDRRKSDGASVVVSDPRVTNFQNWLIGVVGAGIIVTLGWMANSIDNLNRNFAAFSEWRTYVERRLDKLERDNDRP
jgi:hypothetical protein